MRKLSSLLSGIVIVGAGIAVLASGTPAPVQAPASPAKAVPSLGKEVHLANVRQLTFGGENAEAYFSFDGQRLSFQSSQAGGCDQIYSMNIDGSDVKRISQGGRTTCSYYTPDGRSVVYASTFKAGPSCPPVPDFSMGYVWPIYAEYDIYKAEADGTNIQRADDDARLRCRGHHPPGRPHRVHERARRRHGDLLDERRRRRRAPADAPGRAGRRPVLLALGHADRLSRPAR